MSSRRDRVGQAIYEETGLIRPWSGVEAWDKLPDERKEPWRRDADRAIAAMGMVEFGFASFPNKEFELIVRNPASGDEVTLYGSLRDGQNLEKIDKVLPTCVFVAAGHSNVWR